MGINPPRGAATLALRGMLSPGLPPRQVAPRLALSRWQLGLAGELRQAAARSPHATAVIDDAGELTYAQLRERADRCTEWLRVQGHTPQDRIGLLARNHRGAIEVMAGASALGADVVLVNTGLAGAQLARCVEDQGLSRLVHDDEFADAVREAGIRVATTTESELARALDAMPTPHAPSPPTRTGRTIILTSGTTGAPKGAARRTPGGFGPLVSIIERIPLNACDRILISAPIFHTWGYAAMQLAIAMRGTMILQRRFDPAAARDALAEHRVDAMFAVPVMLQRMMELPSDPAGRAARRLRIVATSGSAYPSGFTARFMDEYGDVLYNLYGSTEASWVCIATPGDLRRHPDTVGTPPLGTRVALLDADGQPVPQGEVGRIFAGNDMVFDGYTSGQTKDFRDGMVSTGDLGHVEDGLWFIDGRDDDMVISGGENVYPSEVEALLAQRDDVREVCVVGVPDEQFGQRLVAFVVAREGSDLDEEGVKELVRSQLARHCVPREVHFLEELPRNHTGKVLTRELRGRVC
jgi:acyl-CoA synthetase (AMP-forming)/AMP-acid ligase II